MTSAGTDKRPTRAPERRESEHEFSSWLHDALDLHGWRWVHFRPARTGHGWRTALSGYPGFPDVVAAKAGRVIFAELKSEEGRQTAEQSSWQDQLDGLGTEFYVWWPSDRDEIMEVLRG